MSKLTEQDKHNIKDDWIALREQKVSKTKSLKQLSIKYGVTQKEIKEVADRFDIWLTEAGKEDRDSWNLAKAEREYKLERDEKIRDLFVRFGCWGSSLIVLVFLIYAYTNEGSPNAIAACEARIKSTLKSPSSYKRIDAEENSDFVMIEYEAANSFGVMMRDRRHCSK